MYTPFVVITEYSTRNTGLSVWPFCLSCVCQHFWDWESAHLFSLSYLRLNTPTTDIFVYVHTRRHRWTFIRTFDEYMYASICISGRVCFESVWECICVCVCVIISVCLGLPTCVYTCLSVCPLRAPWRFSHQPQHADGKSKSRLHLLFHHVALPPFFVVITQLSSWVYNQYFCRK